jgi:hypothetical protein
MSDSQLENLGTLLDTMPSIHENTNSMPGPISCDCGYGKKSFIEILGAMNFKVSACVEKLKAVSRKSTISMDYVSDGKPTDDVNVVLEKNLDTFHKSLEEYTLQDDPN